MRLSFAGTWRKYILLWFTDSHSPQTSLICRFDRYTTCLPHSTIISTHILHARTQYFGITAGPKNSTEKITPPTPHEHPCTVEYNNKKARKNRENSANRPTIITHCRHDYWNTNPTTHLVASNTPRSLTSALNTSPNFARDLISSASVPSRP